ncbi:phosphotransferase-like protein [Anaerosporobacter faecicola]|uniref:phosphotransferase-like protein n=1 Tax=Anaerosporobacter faecicola TaxID=2718714 RepID=UPI001439674D|nr:AAA family ATPase [Anaerosporobacter faecicola]
MNTESSQKKNYGDIIYLSGLTSTGKSSMIKELTSRKKQMFFVLGFDMFEETIPEWAYTQEYYSNAIIAMYHAARSLSEQGHDVIIDGLIMKMKGLEHHYEELTKIFEGYPLKIINVHCSFEVLRQRNIARGDRRENQSMEQSKFVEENIPYYYSIDSERNTIAQCVDLLLSKITKS